MKKTSFLSFLGTMLMVFVMGTSGCSGAKQAGSKVKSDNGSLAANQKALLWKISGNKLKQPSYLFGTIHMIPEKDYFMPAYVESALSKSKKVIFEINTDDMSDMSMMGSLMDMMFMEEGTTLKDLLNEEDYKKVKDKLSENPLMALMGDMTDRITFP